MQNRLAANASYLFASRLTSAALNFASVLLASRWLDGPSFGELAVVIVTVSLANAFTTFGIDDVVVRSVARGDRDPLLASLRLQALLATVIVGLFATLASLDVAPISWWVVVGCLGLFPLAVVSSGSAALRGAERLDITLVGSLAAASVQLGFILVVSRQWATVGWFVAALLSGYVVWSVVMLAGCRRAGVDLIRPSVMKWSTLARASWRFAAMVAASAVLAQVGVLIVAMVVDDESAGHLGLATRVVETLRLLPAAGFAVLFPAMARGEPVARPWSVGARGVIAGFGLAAGAWAAAPLVAWAAGGVEAMVWPLRWLSLGLPAMVLRLQQSTWLIANDRERDVFDVAVAVLPFGLVAIAVGAVAGDVEGAAIATALTVWAHAAWLAMLRR